MYLSFQTCSDLILLLFSWPYHWPKQCGRLRIELDTNMIEGKKETEVGGRGRRSGRVRGAMTLVVESLKQPFCIHTYLIMYQVLIFLLPLDAAVNNTARTLFGRSRGPGHRTATGATASKQAALMPPVHEVVVLLGGGCPWPSIGQW